MRGGGSGSRLQSTDSVVGSSCSKPRTMKYLLFQGPTGQKDREDRKVSRRPQAEGGQSRKGRETRAHSPAREHALGQLSSRARDPAAHIREVTPKGGANSARA